MTFVAGAQHLIRFGYPLKSSLLKHFKPLASFSIPFEPSPGHAALVQLVLTVLADRGRRTAS